MPQSCHHLTPLYEPSVQLWYGLCIHGAVLQQELFSLSPGGQHCKGQKHQHSKNDTEAVVQQELTSLSPGGQNIKANIGTHRTRIVKLP
eukprot:1156443-Pelagomonas_calceolata.AAC.6